jgi:hypothetical protein
VLQRLLASPLGIYCTILAIILFALALWLLVRRLQIQTGNRAQGQVIGFRELRKGHPRDPPQFKPIVRFQPRHGSPVEFESSMSANPDRMRLGHPVPVAYRDDRPQQAEIAVAARLWAAPLALLVLALGSLATAWKAGG